jgi:hypothetical protein
VINFEQTVVSILNEGITFSQILKQLKTGQKSLVKINYLGDDNIPKGERIIEPYLLGRTIADNAGIRAYQVRGVTQTIQPGWKIFLVNKIVSWEVLDEPFTIRNDYRKYGDQLFKKITNQIK